jgi:hypothetical protein
MILFTTKFRLAFRVFPEYIIFTQLTINCSFMTQTITTIIYINKYYIAPTYCYVLVAYNGVMKDELN